MPRDSQWSLKYSFACIHESHTAKKLSLQIWLSYSYSSVPDLSHCRKIQIWKPIYFNFFPKTSLQSNNRLQETENQRCRFPFCVNYEGSSIPSNWKIIIEPCTAAKLYAKCDTISTAAPRKTFDPMLNLVMKDDYCARGDMSVSYTHLTKPTKLEL